MKTKYEIRILKFVFLVAFFFLSFVNCYSQSINELEEKLKSASVKDKPGILNQLSESSLPTSADKSIDYAERALKASRKADDINEEAGANVNLANAYAQ